MHLVYSGGGNPRAEITRCLDEIQASGGGALTIHGDHVIDGTVFGQVTNIVIDFGDTGKLTLAEGVAAAALRLRPDRAYTGHVILLRPRFDCSRGVYIGGAGSASAISLYAYEKAEIHDCDLYGGTWQDKHSDSGIVPGGIIDGYISGGTIKGFADLGVYVTRGVAGDPRDGHLLIDGLKIKACRQGIDSKRGYPHVTARSCKIIDCDSAYRMSWVGMDSGETPLPPGCRMDVVGGVVRNANIAFQPEGPAAMNIDGVKVVGARKALGRNQGGMLDGMCIVKGGSTEMIDENLAVEGTTYKPITKLKVMQ